MLYQCSRLWRRRPLIFHSGLPHYTKGYIPKISSDCVVNVDFGQSAGAITMNYHNNVMIKGNDDTRDSIDIRCWRRFNLWWVTVAARQRESERTCGFEYHTKHNNTTVDHTEWKLKCKLREAAKLARCWTELTTSKEPKQCIAWCYWLTMYLILYRVKAGDLGIWCVREYYCTALAVVGGVLETNWVDASSSHLFIYCPTTTTTRPKCVWRFEPTLSDIVIHTTYVDFA